MVQKARYYNVCFILGLIKNRSALITIYILFACWFIYVGLSVFKQAPHQIIKDKVFIKNEINPNIARIDSFKKANHRIPTVNEFNALNKRGNVDYIRDEKSADNSIRDKVKGIDWSKNYVIWVWRGEWAEYYISSTREYITNEYSIRDGIIGMILCFIVGLLPISIFLIRRNIRKNKHRHMVAV